MPIISSGSFNPTSAIVPDLYVVITPPSQLLLNGVASNVVGLVGSATWGPVNTPVAVSSMANYAQAFGPLVNRKYDMGTHAAVIAQQAGSAMLCVRVTDGTDVKASASDATDVTFTAVHSGTFGNNISVTLQAGAKTNTMAAVVGVPGYAAEIFNNIPVPAVITQTVALATTSSTTVTVASTVGITVGMLVTGTGIVSSPTVASVTNGTTLVLSDAQSLGTVLLTFTPPSFASVWPLLATAINNGQNALRGASAWITATAGVGTTAPPSFPTTYTLAGGTDGTSSVTASSVVGLDNSPPTGMYALSGTNLSILDCCDVDDSTLYTTVDAFAVRESCYAIQTLPSGTSVSAGITAKRASGLDSAYSKLMSGDWLWWTDSVNGVVRLISPQAFVAGRLSNLTPQLTSLNQPIFGIAGSQKSGVAGASHAYYSTADLTNLFQAGIDVITNPGAGGWNIWTCRSGHNSSSNISIHLDNYPTLTNFIAKTLAAGMGFYIGKPITKQLFHDVGATLSQFMQNLTGAGLLSAPDGSQPYAVQCNAANNPDSQTKIGIVTATVQAEYPAINEVFIVNLQGGSTITVSLKN